MPKNAIMQLTPGNYAVPTTLESRLAEPDFQEDFKAMADALSAELIALTKQDTQIRFPRAGKGEERVVSEWMDTYREHFVSIMRRLFSEKYPGAVKGREDKVDFLLRENLLPLIEDDLRVFLVHRLATRWAARHYTDGVRIIRPQPVHYGWRVPVLLNDGTTEAAVIALDAEGNLLPKTTSRDTFLAGLKRAA